MKNKELQKILGLLNPELDAGGSDDFGDITEITDVYLKRAYAQSTAVEPRDYVVIRIEPGKVCRD